MISDNFNNGLCFIPEMTIDCNHDPTISDKIFNILTKKYSINMRSSKQKAIGSIINVIFNDPATIVFWSDGTKTVVKCDERDEFDPEKGLAMAICKKHFGGGFYNDIFRKWIPEKTPEIMIDNAISIDDSYEKS